LHDCVPHHATSQGLLWRSRAVSAPSVVGPIAVNIGLVVVAHVLTSARLALVQAPITHRRMDVEFSEGLFSPALEACFYRGSHAATRLKGMSESKSATPPLLAGGGGCAAPFVRVSRTGLTSLAMLSARSALV